MTQEEFEQSMQRIMAPVRAYAAAKDAKLDKVILKKIYYWLLGVGVGYQAISISENEPYITFLKTFLDEVDALYGDELFVADEIQRFAYLFAKAGVDRERGWGYLKRSYLKQKYILKFKYPDLEATHKIYEGTYNKVVPDMDFRDSFR